MGAGQVQREIRHRVPESKAELQCQRACVEGRGWRRRAPSGRLWKSKYIVTGLNTRVSKALKSMVHTIYTVTKRGRKRKINSPSENKTSARSWLPGHREGGGLHDGCEPCPPLISQPNLVPRVWAVVKVQRSESPAAVRLCPGRGRAPTGVQTQVPASGGYGKRERQLGSSESMTRENKRWEGCSRMWGRGDQET